jgi:NhaA family Na+:H+ antiporter
MAWMGLAVGALVILFGLGRYGLRRRRFYAVFGILLWYALTRSGVHGTIAGVLTAWTIPAGPAPASDGGRGSDSPLQIMVTRLHPWTAYCILPLFAFVNSGIRIDAGLIDSLGTRLGLGVALGLAIGKPIGITGVCWAGRLLGVPPLSGGVRLKHLFGAGMLGGIGFTMSIFIAALAFPDGPALDTAKCAVIAAALVSGILGWLHLRVTLRNLPFSEEDPLAPGKAPGLPSRG